LPRLGGFDGSLSELEEGDAQDRDQSLKLGNSEHRDLFRALCADLVQATESVPPREDDMAATIITQRLWRWQELLRRRSARTLSYSERLGLFGELLVLGEWVTGILTLGQAVRTWRGPDKDQQDFLLAGGLLEVKSQLATADRGVRIASEHQLDEISGRIWLCHQRFNAGTEQTQSARTLNEAVAVLRAKLEDEDALAPEIFEARLIEAGYVQREEYDADSWRLATRVFYEVRGGFPRIRSADLRPGVENVSYSIRLTECEPYRVSEEDVLTWVVGTDE